MNFCFLIQDGKKKEDILKPTNPAAQKAALSGTSQYKVSPRPTAKIKPKPIQSLVNGKVSYFCAFHQEVAIKSIFDNLTVDQ